MEQHKAFRKLCVARAKIHMESCERLPAEVGKKQIMRVMGIKIKIKLHSRH